MLPYLQPGFEEVDGRMRHKVRYQNTIKTKVYFYEENLCDAEKALAKKMIRKEMDNFHQTNPKITWYEDAWQIGGEL